jgi:hypothetical protein
MDSSENTKQIPDLIPTHVLYQNKNNDEFFGKYVEERKKIDYKYHTNFTQSRQVFQDALIEQYLANKVSYIQPWIIFTCGCYGSGKTHSIRSLGLSGNEYVHIDPDKIKYMLPEAKEYYQVDSTNANDSLHKEAIFIASLIELISLKMKFPIIVDGSLQDYEWYREYLSKFPECNPSYKVVIMKVSSDLETIVARCERRTAITGRIIPVKLLKDIYEKIPIAYNVLKHFAHLSIEVDNNTYPYISRIQFNNVKQ